MKRLTLLSILLGISFAHSAQALDFHPTESMTLNWAEPGVFQFDSFTIPVGVTVSLTGVNVGLAAPTAYFNIAGNVLVEGALLAPGWNVLMDFYGNFASTNSSHIESYTLSLNSLGSGNLQLGGVVNATGGTSIYPNTSTPGANLIMSSGGVSSGPGAEIILGPIGNIALVQSGNIALVQGGSPTLSAPVPEPKTYGMLLAGLGLIGFIVRKRG